ncbi:hypothetical protein TNCV_3680721 [Trichonephila clavipes]|nr:hypothetical protein TNCV_3680721 [Trichonephila clavipes]
MQGVPGLLGQTLRGNKRTSHTSIQIWIATHGRKRLHSPLSGVVHKAIEGNKPALPQSFQLPLPTEKCSTSYEPRAGRYAH